MSEALQRAHDYGEAVKHVADMRSRLERLLEIFDKHGAQSLRDRADLIYYATDKLMVELLAEAGKQIAADGRAA